MKRQCLAGGGDGPWSAGHVHCHHQPVGEDVRDQAGLGTALGWEGPKTDLLRHIMSALLGAEPAELDDVDVALPVAVGLGAALSTFLGAPLVEGAGVEPLVVALAVALVGPDGGVEQDVVWIGDAIGKVGAFAV